MHQSFEFLRGGGGGHSRGKAVLMLITAENSSPVYGDVCYLVQALLKAGEVGGAFGKGKECDSSCFWLQVKITT